MREEAYKGSLFAGLMVDVYDRLRKDFRQANARLGFLTPPAGSGRIIWVKSDAHPAHARLAVEIVRAIRERRQDVRVVVTFEAEYPEILLPLDRLSRVGQGFGPADRSSATARVLARLQPAGVVGLGHALRPELAWAMNRAGIPGCLVHGCPGTGLESCYGFPNTGSERAAWEGRPMSDASFLSMIVEAQVEPVFQGIAGAHARALFWAPTAEQDRVKTLQALWQRSSLVRTDILFVGANCPGAYRLSAWNGDRRPLAPGSVVWVDDERFWPALSASCLGIHLHEPSEWLLWAVLAGGRVVSALQPRGFDLLRPAPVPSVPDDQLCDFWEGLADRPGEVRLASDDIRRFFWGERRRAAAVTEILLQKVYEW